MMTKEQLNRMVDECETDIRRISVEIEIKLDELYNLQQLRKERRSQRDAWISHPDRFREE
jgi:hypothetical protein